MKVRKEHSQMSARGAVKKASRRQDRARLEQGEIPEILQHENSIFPADFFSGARISNLAQAVGR
jgi:hypothetical protein